MTNEQVGKLALLGAAGIFAFWGVVMHFGGSTLEAVALGVAWLLVVIRVRP